ncbi:MAG: TniQ family protein, partial [Chloroflexi bacterium]|nr:TniQ family protein [Chloroflexota bacterium]
MTNFQPKPLLCRSPRLPDESLAYLLIRLAGLNFYESPQALSRACREWLTTGDNVAVPIHPETWATLSALLQLPPEELYEATPHRFAPVLKPPGNQGEYTTLPSGERRPAVGSRPIQLHLRRWTDVQYCPLCLAGSHHHRLQWQLFAVAACPEHQCLLVRGCASCQSPIRLRDLAAGRCRHCAYTYANAPVSSLAHDTTGLRSQAAIHAWFGFHAAPNAAGYSLPDQPANVLYAVLDGLRRAIASDNLHVAWLHHFGTAFDVPLERAKPVIKPAMVYTLYATAFQGLVNWPAGFYDVLNHLRQKQHGDRSYPGRDIFGPLYVVWLEHNWRHPAFQFVQDAFNEYLLANFTTSPSIMHLRRFREDAALSARLAFITEAEVGRLLNVAPETVRRLKQLGYLSGPGESGHRFYLVERATALSLKARWEQAVPVEEAAGLLGLTKAVVRDLIRAELVTAVRGPSADKSAVWQISYPSLTEFLERLRACTLPLPSSNTLSRGSLTQAAQQLSWYGYNMATVLKLIVEKRVRGYWSGSKDNVSQVQVSLPDIQAFLASLQASRPLVTRGQLARWMGTKSAAVTVWVEKGLLTPVETGERGMLFDRSEAQAFAQAHVFTEGAAEILGVGKLVVQKWARQGRLRPV